MANTEGRYTVQITVTVEAADVSDAYHKVKRTMDVACRRSDLVYVDCEDIAFLPYCANELQHEFSAWPLAVEGSAFCELCQKGMAV